MAEFITVGNDTFEIVDHVPLGYHIWNIGKNMPDGYLPLCRRKRGASEVEKDTLKAIRIDGAQTILAAVGGGQKTLAAMERYVKQHGNSRPGTWSYRQVQRMREALPIMRQIRWVGKSV